jgi:hypothetical protein
VVIFDDRKLIDHQPVVVFGILEVDDLGRIGLDSTLGPVLDGDSLGQEFLKLLIALDQRRRVYAGEFSIGVFEGFRGERRIEPRKGRFQTIGEKGGRVIKAFCKGFFRGYVGAIQVGVAKLTEPSENDSFKVVFGEAWGHILAPCKDQIRFSIDQ